MFPIVPPPHVIESVARRQEQPIRGLHSTPFCCLACLPGARARTAAVSRDASVAAHEHISARDGGRSSQSVTNLCVCVQRPTRCTNQSQCLAFCPLRNSDAKRDCVLGRTEGVARRNQVQLSGEH
jgi:hypothetical protein